MLFLFISDSLCFGTTDPSCSVRKITSTDPWDGGRFVSLRQKASIWPLPFTYERFGPVTQQAMIWCCGDSRRHEMVSSLSYGWRRWTIKEDMAAGKEKNWFKRSFFQTKDKKADSVETATGEEKNIKKEWTRSKKKNKHPTKQKKKEKESLDRRKNNEK